MREEFFNDDEVFIAVEDNDKDAMKEILSISFAIVGQFAQRGCTGKAQRLNKVNSLVCYLYRKAYGESLL